MRIFTKNIQIVGNTLFRVKLFNDKCFEFKKRALNIQTLENVRCQYKDAHKSILYLIYFAKNINSDSSIC